MTSNGCVGSSPTGGTIVPIAQLVLEHRIFNLGVLGSSPLVSTNASLVQWIEQDTSNVWMKVRFFQEVHNKAMSSRVM